MSRPKKDDRPPAHYPQGPQSITFSALEEDDWWALLHALEQRIRCFQEQRSSILRLNDAGLERQVEYYNDSIERLDHLLRSAQKQLSPAFFNPRSSDR
jgi:hypothetical protein